MRATLLFLTLGLAAGCQCGGATAPTVQIVTPFDGAQLVGNGPHAVSGDVRDPDEAIPPGNITWSSDRDGVLAQGALASVRLSNGPHRLTLQAVDSQGQTGSAQISVTVVTGSSTDGGTTMMDGGLPDGGETAPVVTITSPVNGTVFDQGQAIVLQGTAIDTQDGPLPGSALGWTSDRAGNLGSGAQVTFGNAALGTHRIVLSATDRAGNVGLASISITVVVPGTNRAPVVSITAPASGMSLIAGTPFTLTGTATDPEEGVLSGTALAWSSSRDGALGTGTARSVTLSQGAHTLTLTATDSMGANATATVAISVNAPGNQPPTARITAPTSAQTIFQGATVVFTGTGSDPEDGSLTGTSLGWSSSLDGSLGTGSPRSVSTLSVGAHVVTLVATDAGGNTGSSSVQVTVLPANQAPVVAITTPVSGTTVSAGMSVTFAGTATDPEDGVLTGASLRWSSSRDGSLGTGSPLSTAALSVGTHTIALAATDGGGRTTTATLTLTVTTSTSNVPPLARLTGPVTGQATSLLAFDGSSSTDSDGSIVTYRFDFGDGTPAVSGASAQASHAWANAGTYTVTLIVTDNQAATGTTTLTLSITAFVRVPIVALPATAESANACDLETPGSRVFVAWTTVVHPSLQFGELVNGAVQAETVDGLGFATGGSVASFVSLKLAADGTPHLLYNRNGQVFYATRSGATWLRERVDSTALPLYQGVAALALTATGAPLVVYTSYSSYYRPAVAVRTGAGAWTQSVAFPASGLSTTTSYTLAGEATVDAAGRLLFPIQGNSNSWLMSWTAAATEVVTFSKTIGGFASAAGRGARLYLLASTGLYDLALNTTFPNTTFQQSLVETFSLTQNAVAIDAAGLPRLLSNHSGTLEAIAPGAGNFWERLELGAVDSGGIGASVDGADQTRACFIRAGNLMVY